MFNVFKSSKSVNGSSTTLSLPGTGSPGAFDLPDNLKQVVRGLHKTPPETLPDKTADYHEVQVFLYQLLTVQEYKVAKFWPQWVLETVAQWKGTGADFLALDRKALEKLCPLDQGHVRLAPRQATESFPPPECRERIGMAIATRVAELKRKEEQRDKVRKEWEQTQVDGSALRRLYEGRTRGMVPTNTTDFNSSNPDDRPVSTARSLRSAKSARFTSFTHNFRVPGAYPRSSQPNLHSASVSTSMQGFRLNSIGQLSSGGTGSGSGGGSGWSNSTDPPTPPVRPASLVHSSSRSTLRPRHLAPSIRSQPSTSSMHPSRVVTPKLMRHVLPTEHKHSPSAAQQARNMPYQQQLSNGSISTAYLPAPSVSSRDTISRYGSQSCISPAPPSVHCAAGHGPRGSLYSSPSVVYTAAGFGSQGWQSPQPSSYYSLECPPNGYPAQCPHHPAMDPRIFSTAMDPCTLYSAGFNLSGYFPPPDQIPLPSSVPSRFPSRSISCQSTTDMRRPSLDQMFPSSSSTSMGSMRQFMQQPNLPTPSLASSKARSVNSSIRALQYVPEDAPLPPMSTTSSSSRRAHWPSGNKTPTVSAFTGPNRSATNFAVDQRALAQGEYVAFKATPCRARDQFSEARQKRLESVAPDIFGKLDQRQGPVMRLQSYDGQNMPTLVERIEQRELLDGKRQAGSVGANGLYSDPMRTNSKMFRGMGG
ncbi:uncharacterized protein BDR25DRAFT_319900 [Lindgomyces ingoldianus]|uniref:Uncharacterized protein n=1 Tax=Lindgomyces ingoldianus TaxID=673940 RepID=A0ACB6Q9E3_9PLEO|nr:uncharacterized protein BDR25DRAFT_319900 [Lindgomyces ingoldianus]KAF2463524.1 hypothetical protein BDR25DRAFT_319900 [Lindgomyces ingoldianus]